jgi:ribosomal protein S13
MFFSPKAPNFIKPGKKNFNPQMNNTNNKNTVAAKALNTALFQPYSIGPNNQRQKNDLTVLQQMLFNTTTQYVENATINDDGSVRQLTEQDVKNIENLILNCITGFSVAIETLLKVKPQIEAEAK